MDSNEQKLVYQDDEIDLLELWQTIWQNKFFIIIFCSIIVVVTAVKSLMMDNIYKSESTIMPISSKSGGLSAYAGLAAMAGINIPVGGGDDSTKIEAVLKSRTIKERVIKELDLIKILNEKPIPEKRDPLLFTLEKLDKMISINTDKKTGVINLGVEHKDPKLAQKIANSMISNLQKILNEKALTVAKFNRVFLEEQVKINGEKFLKLQEKMAKFQKDTKILAPEAQMKGLMDLYGSLVAKRIETQVKLKSMESALDKNNPQVKALQDQLNAINAQIAQLEQKTNIKAIPSMSQIPESMVDYAQIMQELSVAKAVYENLVKAYEQAKIEEAKDNLYVQVIDEPSLPDRKVKPKRTLMVAVAGVTSLILAIFIVFFREWIKTNRERSGEVVRG